MKKLIAVFCMALLGAGCATAGPSVNPPTTATTVVTDATTVENIVTAAVPVAEIVVADLSAGNFISASDVTAADNWLNTISTQNNNAIAITKAAGASDSSVIAALESVVAAINAQPTLASVTDATSQAKLKAAIASISAVVTFVTSLSANGTI